MTFLLLLLLLLGLLLTAHTASSGSFVYAGCSPTKYPPNTPFQANLNSLLTSISTSAAAGSSYTSLAAGNSSSPVLPLTAAYGLFQCRTDLTPSDCSTCVQSAVGQINLVCPSAYAASLQLEPCLVRYSSDDFLGAPDTSLVYRKCSPDATGGKDGDFLRRRDDVVAGLRGGGGYFRVSSSGAVQGYAQCLGDLAAGDCAACLEEAVRQLETTCGAAPAADVFLAQCYARYWASGYYLRYSPAYSDDDIGKTVAIIIGIVAGLAIFVVFISFLKRAC